MLTKSVQHNDETTSSLENPNVRMNLIVVDVVAAAPDMSEGENSTKQPWSPERFAMSPSRSEKSTNDDDDSMPRSW